MIRNGDFEGGRGFPAPQGDEFQGDDDLGDMGEISNVNVIRGGFDTPLISGWMETMNTPIESDSLPLSDPNQLRAQINAKAASEARHAYNHWIEAVSFLRITEPGAEKAFGAVTKGLLDAATYMEGKE